MLVTDFDFDLPAELIAQQPPAERGDARMLALNRHTGAWRDCFFTDFPSMLCEGDLLVLNNSRVIPARLFAQRALGGRSQAPAGQAYSGKIEVLLTQPQKEMDWEALVRPARKVPVGEELLFFAAGQRDPVLSAEVIARGDFGARTLRFKVHGTPANHQYSHEAAQPDLYAILDRIGHIPLPPYIHRDPQGDSSSDRERYQTIYAQDRGSVAAPTAGLHFTAAVLDDLRERGVRIAFVTLHVGLGTFAPLRVDRVDQIHLHAERYTLPQQTADQINAARREGRRVIAVGTTTVRTLEHCGRLAASAPADAPSGQPLRGHSGSTSIFISPGFPFRIVNAMLTNFHLPQSSLLMLVSAFAGREEVLAAYRHAVDSRYRFFSYGDCMWIA